MQWVAELMTRDPVCVGPDATALDVASILYSRRCHHVPVVDDDGGLAGIVSDRDLLGVLQRVARDALDEVPVRELMTAVVRVVEPTDTVAAAAEALLRHGVHALPVVEDGRLVGILTARDFVRLHVRKPPA